MKTRNMTFTHTKIQYTVYSQDSLLKIVNFLYSDMLLELKLERVGNSNLIQAEALRNINLHIKLSKNKARIRIFDQVSDNNINKINNNNNVNNNINNNNNNFDKSGSGYAFPTSLFDTEDLEMANDGKIEDLSESNISIQIINHPFSFALYRKDTGERIFDTTHSNESSIFDHYLFYAKNYIQISTRLTKGHFTYGLGERFTSLRLKNGKYVHWSAERTGSPVGQESLENYYSAIPAYMTVNPDSGNACGVFMMNSSPSEVVLEDSYLTFKMISGNIDLFVFSGPRPREVVQQFQNTFGLPLVPPYSAMNWHANMISNQLRRDLLAFNSTLSSISRLLPVETLWIDHQVNLDTNNLKDSEVILQSIKEQGLAVFIYKQSPLSVNSNLFETAKNRSILITKSNGDIFEGRSSYGNVCFLDYFSHNAHDFIITEFVREPLFKYNISAVTLYKNEPAHNCDGDCKSPQKNKFVFSPGQDKNYNLEEQTLPLNAKQAENGNSLLNTHNLYSLQETRTYYHALTDSGISRPLIFSRSVFFGNQQYAGKWLGHLESSWKGLQLALIQTLNFNKLLGNPHTIHEACGFSRFSPNPSEKIKERERDGKFSQELCIRWLQFSAVNPYSRLNDFDILPYFEKLKHQSYIEDLAKIRNMLTVYIYGYLLKLSLEGGSLIRPMFYEFKSERMKKELYEISSQFLLGSNLLVSPVLLPNERKKKTYFPASRFYSFYTGEKIEVGENFYTVDAPLNILPMFFREGFITPIQNTSEIKKLSELRKMPIDLVVALDSSYRASGNIMFDDGMSSNFTKKREYYRMDITSLQTSDSKNVEIIFKKKENEFMIKDYMTISRVKILGLNFNPSRIFTQLRKKDQSVVSEINWEFTKYNKNTSVLDIEQINLSLDESSFKIVLQHDN